MNRRISLAGLASVVAEIPEIITVVRTYKEIDITQYLAAELPLVEIREPEEVPVAELTGQRALQSLEVTLKVWFVNWGDNPLAAYEELMRLLRNKIGANFTLAGETCATWITRISPIDGTMPVFWYEMGLTMHYYLNQKDA